MRGGRRRARLNHSGSRYERGSARLTALQLRLQELDFLLLCRYLLLGLQERFAESVQLSPNVRGVRRRIVRVRGGLAKREARYYQQEPCRSQKNSHRNPQYD